jgi:hypothetical protein
MSGEGIVKYVTNGRSILVDGGGGGKSGRLRNGIP